MAITKTMRTKKITFYVSEKELEQITLAMRIVALDKSGFCRTSTIEKSNIILKNMEASSQ